MDKAMERQSQAQTEVINMQLRKVIGELDMMHERLEAQQAALDQKVSARRVADMERILQVRRAPRVRIRRGARQRGPCCAGARD